MHAARELVCPFLLGLFLALNRHVQQVESVLDEVKFDALVQWTIRAKTRQMVYFDEPRLQLLVNHDVHAEDLIAH